MEFVKKKQRFFPPTDPFFKGDLKHRYFFFLALYAIQHPPHFLSCSWGKDVVYLMLQLNLETLDQRKLAEAEQ